MEYWVIVVIINEQQTYNKAKKNQEGMLLI
jgi:hypothetical protein